MGKDSDVPHLNLNLDLNLPQYRWQTFSASCSIDAIAWCHNSLASTMWAAARARQTTAIMENKITALTECRVQNKPSRFVTRDGLHDMSQMLLDLPFPNPQHLC